MTTGRMWWKFEEGAEAVGVYVEKLGRDGAYPRTSRSVYKAVVQLTLLFGAVSRVMLSQIWRTLGGFHHSVAHHLVVMQLQRKE